ncbi:MAG: cyclic nucleotide-binding domain-containing protein [Phenylobacterium sp.]|uniref:Crp/Fnr family transcriptional regulator n=1 Tax=Phenylobacterium sp. TaxID=1871053 RepID=UPI001A44C6B3|nr:cyclic nucleotide-binding domain-containing protein [Phenylobacterium sp.]MBL8772757.1 cyclic nucleotide-binding domain-containing protein [Phenylobacterium sp.]
MSAELLDLCGDLPVVDFAPGEALLDEGQTSGRLYVLIGGEVEIVKGDFQIDVVTEPGAIFGEMSVLLAAPHMATVRAVTPCRAYRSTEGEAFLRSHPEIAYHLARVLAQRLNGVTGYLVDLKRQFEGERSHLGFVDEILETLVHNQGPAFTPGSDRDPG